MAAKKKAEAKKRARRKRRKASHGAGRAEIRSVLLAMARDQENRPIVAVRVSYPELRRGSIELDRLSQEALATRLKELHDSGAAWVADREERQRGFRFTDHGFADEGRRFRVILLSYDFHKALGFVAVHDHEYVEWVENEVPQAAYWKSGEGPPAVDYGPPPPRWPPHRPAPPAPTP